MCKDVGQKYMCAANIINILAAWYFPVDVLLGVILLLYYHSQTFEIFHIFKQRISLFILRFTVHDGWQTWKCSCVC